MKQLHESDFKRIAERLAALEREAEQTDRVSREIEESVLRAKRESVRLKEKSARVKRRLRESY